MNARDKKPNISDTRFIKLFTVGGIDPNNPVSDEKLALQTERLNRCLNGYPKGYIIGKDISIGRYVIGEHELSMQRVNYHVAFSRKPEWIDEYEKNSF